MKAKVVSKDEWKRGKRAERTGRKAGRNGNPQAITNDQLEEIENQVLVLLSNQTIVQIRDVQNMAALARHTDVAKISAQSPENIRGWFSELLSTVMEDNITAADRFNFDESSNTCGESSSKLVVCFKDQTPPGVPSPPKVPNATICLCVCADGSSLPRFLLHTKKTLPKEFRTLSSFDIRYIFSSSGWITKDIFKNIMINYWIPLIVEKVKPTSSHRALLLMDNHSTHNDETVIEAAKKILSF
ncbi:uncharacterized protein MONOS_14365 [Monocercomonoides exilis]|uniref:uncharacterized protein n=1 Tax=Monocercomonoides exilis TaxID=2049356 RepID=UPI00355AC9D6|nr:hypothetical protein MONOS_14365 [Monocercomonoides exilis]|eukprot:MONOS_14365.1-p1 / transcript=MONOS_14365.1 / gene=MONOS_14365 / organism=Monocercomonoides_exilis_PA203 / gene_product=unspecified product / transcript_product=unspecified product / location=Mono_scaffold00990:1953-2832(-) / protein_length=242 / sequence_SO=supercontig / SO=protein_coding / is_pseudo=false